MATNKEGEYILTVTEKGFGKKSLLDDFRITNRGAKGVKALNITEKTGNIVCMKAVRGDEDCMIMTDDGIVIRISLNTVSVYGRGAQGVKLIRVDDSKKVSNVEVLDAAVSEETTAETESAEVPADDDSQKETE